MENSQLMKKRAKIAAFLVGFSGLLGFYRIMFEPDVYRNPFTPYFILGFAGFLPVGVLLASLLGVPTYFFFKKFIRNTLIYIFVLFIVILTAWALGYYLELCIFRQSIK